jgi:hypothetical protein
MLIGAIISFHYLNITELVARRFVDRDMVMRYHWGLAVGHVYTHGQTTSKDIAATASNITHEHSESDLEYADTAVGDWEDVDHLDDDGLAVDLSDNDIRADDFSDDGILVDDFSDDDMAAAMYDMYDE